MCLICTALLNTLPGQLYDVIDATLRRGSCWNRNCHQRLPAVPGGLAECRALTLPSTAAPIEVIGGTRDTTQPVHAPATLSDTEPLGASRECAAQHGLRCPPAADASCASHAKGKTWRRLSPELPATISARCSLAFLCCVRAEDDVSAGPGLDTWSARVQLSTYYPTMHTVTRTGCG